MIKEVQQNKEMREAKMKIRIERISRGEEEIILRYREETPEMEALLRYLNKTSRTLLGKKNGQEVIVTPGDVIYLESVDGETFLYTKEEVMGTGISLAAAEAEFVQEGFFRCSKSMVLNIYHIDRLKSESGNRIDAQMDNGEHVMISRRYAKALRRVLKGDKGG